MALTILLTLTLGVIVGLIAGIGTSLMMYLYRTSKPHVAIVGQVPGTQSFKNIDRHEVVTSCPGGFHAYRRKYLLPQRQVPGIKG